MAMEITSVATTSLTKTTGVLISLMINVAVSRGVGVAVRVGVKVMVGVFDGVRLGVDVLAGGGLGMRSSTEQACKMSKVHRSNNVLRIASSSKEFFSLYRPLCTRSITYPGQTSVRRS